MSQDGHTDGITVPREEAQEAAIRTALRRAGVADRGRIRGSARHRNTRRRPHRDAGTGQCVDVGRPATDPLLIGSIKTNIGHLEAGAGVAGLIKAALVAKHAYIPANLHLLNPTRHVLLAELKIDVPGTGRPFPDYERRVVGVNSFGFGGTNAHVVLAEPPAPACASAVDHPPQLSPTVLPISARSEEALVATAGRLAEHLASHPDVTLSDLGYTLGQRRTHLDHRHTVIADSITDAREQLQALADGGQIATSRPESTTPKLAFVCTGMGPQWWQMCRGLLDVFPTFTDSILRSDRELSRYTDWSLNDELPTR